MKKIIFTVMLALTFNGESRAILHSMHSICDVQKEEKIILDNNLSEIIGGANFMDGFCAAVTVAGVAAYFFAAACSTCVSGKRALWIVWHIHTFRINLKRYLWWVFNKMNTHRFYTMNILESLVPDLKALHRKRFLLIIALFNLMPILYAIRPLLKNSADLNDWYLSVFLMFVGGFGPSLNFGGNYWGIEGGFVFHRLVSPFSIKKVIYSKIMLSLLVFLIIIFFFILHANIF
jgi:hypothetical protein